MSDGTDRQLAERAAAGDRAAFAVLAERHYDRVYRLAWRWSGTQTLAEDIAQDVMLKLATAIRSFRGDAEFSTWLYRIAYTAAIDHQRAAQRIVSFAPSDMMMLTQAAPLEPAVSTPEDEVIGAELWQAVRALPDQQRDAVLLVYGEDLTHLEAAEIMGCAEKTVSWHLFEARKRLRTKLEAVG